MKKTTKKENNNVAKTVFLKAVSKESGIPIENVKEVAKAMEGLIFDYLKDGKDVSVFGGIKFKFVDQAPCVRRNPKTGERVNVPHKKNVKVKVSNGFKEKLNEG